MQLTIIGCMGGYPDSDNATSSYLLESDGFKLLMDFGSGAYSKLNQLMDPTDVDALILSHDHHDHVADVGVLQYAIQLKPSLENKQTKTLPIYVHSESQLLNQLTMPNISKVHLYQEMDELNVGPFAITFLRTIHPVTCYAMKIIQRISKKTFVFTADSAYFKELVSFCSGADLLLADGMLDGFITDSKAHMSAKQVGELAHQAGVKRAIITHLPPSNQERLHEQAKQMTDVPIHLARSYDEYVI